LTIEGFEGFSPGMRQGDEQPEQNSASGVPANSNEPVEKLGFVN